MKPLLGIEFQIEGTLIPLLPTAIIGSSAVGKTHLLLDLIERLDALNVDTLYYNRETIKQANISKEIEQRWGDRRPLVVLIDDVSEMCDEIQKLLSFNAFECGIVGIIASQNKTIVKSINSTVNILFF